MTVVNPKSISGINSITTGSGSDDILTIHTNNGTERLRVDSTGTTKIVTGIVTTLTATSSAKVGSGVTLSSDGDIFATGVTTATTFSGSGASLTNLPSAQLTGALPALDGSNLTGLSGVSVASQADNRLITCTGTSDALTGESNLSFTSNTLTVHEASLKGNQLLFGASGTAYIDHSTTGQDIQFRTSVSSSQDTTGPTIKSTGNIAFASGKGIDFSATSNSGTSELFDDYEEGTWTPYLNFSGTNNAATMDIQQGMYRKIGTMIFAAYAIRSTNFNSSTGAVRVAGLPYTSTNTPVANISNSGVFPITGVSFTGEFISQQLSGSVIELYGVSKNSSGNVYSSISVNEMNQTGQMFLKGSIFYNTP